jgi:hypothetical protein
MTEGLADLGTVKLFYWDTGGPGDAIVFLHPGSGSAEVFPYQQPVFANAGYRVISYSCRGQFKSELGSDSETCFAADDLLALMDDVQEVGPSYRVANPEGLAEWAINGAVSKLRLSTTSILPKTRLMLSNPGRGFLCLSMLKTLMSKLMACRAGA